MPHLKLERAPFTQASSNAIKTQGLNQVPACAPTRPFRILPPPYITAAESVVAKQEVMLATVKHGFEALPGKGNSS